jgi:hypothetical protein
MKDARRSREDWARPDDLCLGMSPGRRNPGEQLDGGAVGILEVDGALVAAVDRPFEGDAGGREAGHGLLEVLAVHVKGEVIHVAGSGLGGREDGGALLGDKIGDEGIVARVEEQVLLPGHVQVVLPQDKLHAERSR